MEALMSAGERKQRIIASIIEDFSLKPRLNNDRGTAILVAASIYDACHYFRLFQNTNFGAYCGIVTSFEPNHNAISREPPNSDERYKFDTYTQHVLKKDQTTKHYEDEIKRRFIQEPANLKLLIVVSKLLTGFDAPSCTYIYLDNELRDHNLFQAICRTNRLDGDDKDYGYIVDSRSCSVTFRRPSRCIAPTSWTSTRATVATTTCVSRTGWRKAGSSSTTPARRCTTCASRCRNREMEQYLHYFCGDAANPEALNDRAAAVSFYKAVTLCLCAPTPTGPDPAEAGYSEPGGGDQAGGRVLETAPRSRSTRRRAGHQALRGGHAPPHQHLHPGRRRGAAGKSARCR
jgi:type I restriction enzyme R subunit